MLLIHINVFVRDWLGGRCEEPTFAPMTYFSIRLREEGGATQLLGTVPFASLAEAEADVRAALRETAADLVRAGQDPARFCYEIRGEADDLLREVPLASRG